MRPDKTHCSIIEDIMEKSLIVHARVMKAMSDENRLLIMGYLKERECNASELLSRLQFGQSTLSHHMGLLKQAGVVKTRKEGKWVYYSLNEEMISSLREWLGQYTE